MMLTTPTFTLEDLIQEPEPGYDNFEGENRVFIMFKTVSPEMARLKEGDKFDYESKVYRVMVRMPPDENHPQSVQFNCLENGNKKIALA